MIAGRTLPTGREIARHEAYHAAGLCLAGMVPKCVRTDWPERGLAGLVSVDWGDGPDRDSARSVLVAVVVGGMTDGAEGWKCWPIRPEGVPAGARRDAEQARHLAEYLRLDHAGWLHVIWKAGRLACRQDFRRLVVRIANELERVEVLHAQDLRDLMAQDREAVAA